MSEFIEVLKLFAGSQWPPVIVGILALYWWIDGKFKALESRMDADRKVSDERFKSLAAQMDHGFKATDERFKALVAQMDHGFKGTDKQFAAVGDQFKAVNARLDNHDARLGRIETALDTVKDQGADNAAQIVILQERLPRPEPMVASKPSAKPSAEARKPSAKPSAVAGKARALGG